jgi:hypothetical protein
MNEISPSSVSERQTWSPRTENTQGDSSSPDSDYTIGIAHAKVLNTIIEKQTKEIENLSARVYDFQTAREQSGLIMKSLGGLTILAFALGIFVGEHL